jgi:hypothetical protein
MTDTSRSERQIDVTVFVCPVCLTVGGKGDRCGHYESGSVGWVYYTRRPATLAVTPNGWEPVTDSREAVRGV